MTLVVYPEPRPAISTFLVQLKLGIVGIAHHCLILIASGIGHVQRFFAMFEPVSIQSLGRYQPGRVGIAHHCLMLIASEIGHVQRFFAMFERLSIQ
ncbi:MAG: hypothetical protein VR64_02855 [Desulfatitalea sp. BRH_c12]|nr:MAG: hypothetical protein VR64_02855 [Desulfatitalea sp. BRH_c12]